MAGDTRSAGAVAAAAFPGAGADAMRETTMAGKLTRSEQRAVRRLQRQMSRDSGYDVDWGEAVDAWQRDYAKQWRASRLALMMARQREEIQRHKWIESEKARRDLGQAAVLDWIHHHAAEFRRWYDDAADDDE